MYRCPLLISARQKREFAEQRELEAEARVEMQERFEKLRVKTDLTAAEEEEFAELFDEILQAHWDWLREG